MKKSVGKEHAFYQIMKDKECKYFVLFKANKLGAAKIKTLIENSPIQDQMQQSQAWFIASSLDDIQ